MTNHLLPPARLLALASLALGLGAAAVAHVTLPPGGGVAGADHDAAFRVGHACHGTPATTGITVRVPAGFTVRGAEPRAGWTLAVAPDSVSWRADTPAAALPTAERAEFIVHGKLPDRPQTLVFKVLQTCGDTSADWATVPTGPDDKPEFPAVRLEVRAP